MRFAVIGASWRHVAAGIDSEWCSPLCAVGLPGVNAIQRIVGETVVPRRRIPVVPDLIDVAVVAQRAGTERTWQGPGDLHAQVKVKAFAENWILAGDSGGKQNRLQTVILAIVGDDAGVSGRPA